MNDATGGDDGNDERSAYLFNTHRVRPSGVAGEISAWDALRDQIGVARTDLKRPAYMTGFRTAWKDFALINLHLHPGEEDAEDDQPADRTVRQQEVRLLLATLAERMDSLWTKNLVLVGDMNFYRSEDQATIDLNPRGRFLGKRGPCRADHQHHRRSRRWRSLRPHVLQG